MMPNSPTSVAISSSVWLACVYVLTACCVCTTMGGPGVLSRGTGPGTTSSPAIRTACMLPANRTYGVQPAAMPALMQHTTAAGTYGHTKHARAHSSNAVALANMPVLFRSCRNPRLYTFRSPDGLVETFAYTRSTPPSLCAEIQA